MHTPVRPYHAQAKKFAVYGGCFEVLNTGFQRLIKAHGSLSLDKASLRSVWEAR